jgi:hypothetical protein
MIIVVPRAFRLCTRRFSRDPAFGQGVFTDFKEAAPDQLNEN